MAQSRPESIAPSTTEASPADRTPTGARHAHYRRGASKLGRPTPLTAGRLLVVAMIRIEPRAAAALAPLIKLATEMEPTRSNALDPHVKILKAFTASLDHDFLIGRTRATEAGALDGERVDEDGLDAEPELFVDGWIVAARRRGGSRAVSDLRNGTRTSAFA